MKKILVSFFILISFFYAKISLANWVEYRVCSNVEGVRIVHGDMFFPIIPQGACYPSSTDFYRESIILSGVSLALDRESTLLRQGNMDSYLANKQQIILTVTSVDHSGNESCGIDMDNPGRTYRWRRIYFTISGKDTSPVNGSVRTCY